MKGQNYKHNQRPRSPPRLPSLNPTAEAKPSRATAALKKESKPEASEIDSIMRKLVERSIEDKPDDIVTHMLDVLTEVESDNPRRPLAHAQDMDSYDRAIEQLDRENAWLRENIARLDMELSVIDEKIVLKNPELAVTRARPKAEAKQPSQAVLSNSKSLSLPIPELEEKHHHGQAVPLLSARTLARFGQWAKFGKLTKRVTDPHGGEYSDKITILHFNDVYNIEGQEQEPVGGAARFATKIQQFRDQGLNPLVLFSGDAFSPSIMSTVVKGKQMPPCLNAFGIHTACYGNHDFDFGLDSLEKLAAETNFTWLISNAVDVETNAPLGDGQEYRIFEWAGHKIGVIGLIEKEWLETLATIDVKDVQYTDYVEKGRYLEKLLRREGCEMVIALTHMRVPNDRRLAEEVPQLDLILGGHDHHYEAIYLPKKNRYVFKSGTDFRDLTQITVKFDDLNMANVIDHKRIVIDSSVPENPEVKQIVDKYKAMVGEKMEATLGKCAVALDSRFQSIRTKETNIGNFVCDIIKSTTKANCVILNSGTLRADCIFKPGAFKMRDLVQLLPMCDQMAVIEMTGEKLLTTLENGVSQYPKLEGRFPQVSGIVFSFDPEKPAGSRVVSGSVKVEGSPLVSTKTYEVCIKEYLLAGKDGYTMLPECKVLKEGEAMPPLPTMVRNHFTVLAHASGSKPPLTDRFKRRMSSKLLHKINLDTHAGAPDGDHIMEGGEVLINPAVEGRIINVHEGAPPARASRRPSAQIPSGPAEEITILHFNDVYNIEGFDKEPVGGAARFATAIDGFKKQGLNPLVLFSGDAFAPSIMSTVLKGKQMVPCLNELSIKVACYGNHDFDFGLGHLAELAADTNFPWLISNAIDKHTNEPLGKGQNYVIFDWEGKKIGIMGLIEREWLETLATIEVEDVLYTDFVEKATTLEAQMRRNGCDMVIALTHMRVPNDQRLARECPQLDLILGGHDHHYEVINIAGQYVFKSGTDFMDLTRIKVKFGNGRPVVVDHERIVVDSSFPEKPEVKAIVDEFNKAVGEKMDEPLGFSTVELDSRFKSIRTQETNIGNFVCDIIRETSGADIVILNSGTLRADRLIEPGPFKMRDLMTLLPMCDEMVVIGMTGAQVLQALENGVSQHPRLEGRFPQVSGVCFAFDPELDPGARIKTDSIAVGGNKIDMNAHYQVCIKGYLLAGKDGYSMFPGCPMLKDTESLPALNTMVRNHFTVLGTASGVKKHKDRFMRRKSSALLTDIRTQRLSSSTPRPMSGRQSSHGHHHTHDDEQGVRISPVVDGRIINLQDGAHPPALAAPVQPMNQEKGKEICIIHFNDVYNIEGQEKEPRGGIARFATAIQRHRDEGLNPLVLFSGDAFAPSIMSTVVKGKQMPPSLNMLQIHTACYGNHDFDFGIEALEELAGETNFDWLMSNAVDKHTNKPLGGGIETKEFEWQGKKIGLMGLIEREWLETLATIEVNEVLYTDFVEKGAHLEKELRKRGCDMVIALTHMRVPNDERLARECPQIDLILGGHDHHYEVINIAGRHIFKSGTDFRDLTKIMINFDGQRPSVSAHEHIVVDSSFPEDPEVKAIVAEYEKLVDGEMDKPLGRTAVELDSRFASIRTMETNIGNFVCDIIKEATKSEMVILNSGTLRADCIFTPGPFKMRDMVQLLPMCDEMAVIEMTGDKVLAALENGVCKYPRLEGRFPQVSGVSFSFDPDGKEGHRVVTNSVKVNGENLDLNKTYQVCIKAYLLAGKDGYTMFPGCPILKSGEDLLTLPNMVRNHFTHMQAASGMKTTRDHKIRRSSTMILKSARQGSSHHIFDAADGVLIQSQVEGRIINIKAGFTPQPSRPGTAMKPLPSGSSRITVVHFNDVYNIEAQTKEPVGGVARFATAINRMKDQGLNPLVFFSGDAFSPSIMSTVVHGIQMPPCLNELSINTACYGNHDFDFGLESLEKLSGACNFPWLMSNAFDKRTNKPLGDGKEFRIIEWEGHKIGLIGLIESEWLDTLGTIHPEDVTYIDFVEKGKSLEMMLRREGCEMVIALTHMRVPNDHRLAKECPGLDLILGGHDHHYEVMNVEGKYVFKSGTDFRDLSQITVQFGPSGPSIAHHEHVVINSDIPEDPKVKEIVNKFQAQVGDSMEEVLVITETDLDCQFQSIRTKETNLGNFITDVMRSYGECDVVLLNSGTLRSDMVHEVGAFTMGDLLKVLPMVDELCVIEMPGDKLLAALENGVSKYPALEGRFPQVSNVRFQFDPSKPPSHRVVEGSVMVGGQPLELSKKYDVMIMDYLRSGHDGYVMFTNCPIVKEGEMLPPVVTMLKNHFAMLKHTSDHTHKTDRNLSRQSSQLLSTLHQRKSRSHSLGKSGNNFKVNICPKVEGRIVNIEDDQMPALIERQESQESISNKEHEITIVHFNNVCNIEGHDEEPKGGAARFTAAIKQYTEEGLNPLVLFSGNAFSPSMLSTLHNGKQMPPCLNQIGIHTACLGNRDFDFGLEVLDELTKDTNFPWLMSNVIYTKTNKPLGNGLEHRIFDWDGHKIGVMGLLGQEWLYTISCIEVEHVQYTDFVEKGRSLEAFFRQEGCELVIALTHMGLPNDQRLAMEVPQIDLILGANGCKYEVHHVAGQYIFKSGVDFRELSRIKIDLGGDRPKVVDHEHVRVLSSDFPEDTVVKQIVQGYTSEVGEKMDEALGMFNVDLDSRFISIRTKETNIGNFVSDIIQEATKADCVILNSGTLRSDRIHNSGVFKMQDLFHLLPLVDKVCVVELSGSKLLHALENGVSQYPRLNGRFPQVSGLKFSFDPNRPSNSRIEQASVFVCGEPLSLERNYAVGIKEYLLDGKDGYFMFCGSPILKEAAKLPTIITMVQSYFSKAPKSDGVAQFSPQLERRINNLQSPQDM